MASSQHVEVEAAKLLQKLIQESKDEPAKLATKLYVVCSRKLYAVHENVELNHNLISLFDVPDMSTYEVKWKRAISAISGHI